MVKLRLKRMGQKFKAFYRIVAADSRAPRDGRFIEELGYYNPHTKELLINNELKDKWLGEGAIPSETVKALFRKYKVAKVDENGIAILSVKTKVKKVTTPVVEEVKPVEEPEVVEEVVVDTKAEDEEAKAAAAKKLEEEAKAAAEAKAQADAEAKKLEEEKATAEAKRLEEAKAADDSAAKAAEEAKAQADAEAKKLEEEKAAAEAEAAKKVKKPKKPSVPALKIAIFKEMMAEESGLSKANVGLAINSIVKAISETVKKDQSVALSGLGTFERVFKKARAGINPLTGEALQIAAKNSPKFKVAKDFKEVVANSAKSNK